MPALTYLDRMENIKDLKAEIAEQEVIVKRISDRNRAIKKDLSVEGNKLKQMKQKLMQLRRQS